MFLLRLKQKSHMQLQKHTKTQLKKDFDKNGEYRYVLVTIETKKPYAIAKTYKDAMEAVERSYEYDYPLYVVDLLYWKG
nr:MAG TPA: hypothetical protein [Caudoviricetes sp.]